MDAKAYYYYQNLIPYSWRSTRPHQMNIRVSDLTKSQISEIQNMVHRGNYSQADVIAMGVSLLHRHMSKEGSPELPAADPKDIISRSI